MNFHSEEHMHPLAFFSRKINFWKQCVLNKNVTMTHSAFLVVIQGGLCISVFPKNHGNLNNSLNI